MSLLPLLSESLGKECTSLIPREKVHSRYNPSRLGMVRILMEPGALSIDNLSVLLRKLMNRLSASGVRLILMADRDYPVVSIGDVEQSGFYYFNESQMLNDLVLEFGGNLYYPLPVLGQVVGYLQIRLDKKNRPDYWNDVLDAYADIISREMELDLKNRKLEADKSILEHKKTQFKRWQLRSRRVLNMITHDLKSPLLAASGYLQLLSTKFKLGTENTRKNQYFEKIRSGLDDMSEVVGQINDLLFHVNDNAPVLKVEVELTWLVREVVDLMVPVARNKKISLTFSGLTEPVYAEVDVVKTKRIVYNLISNSIKYTPGGGNIQVAVKTNGQEILVSVADDGYGISQDKMRTIFQPYERGDAPDAAESSSSGLGLSISDMFARLMGGRISAESTPGMGSVFTFHLPSSVNQMNPLNF